MVLILIFMAVIAILELIIWLPPTWPVHQQLAVPVFALLVLGSGWLVIKNPNIWTTVIVLFSIYRLINLWRLVKNRVQPDYLYTVTLQASVSLIGSQVLVASLWVASRHYHSQTHWWLYSISLLQLIVSASLYLATRFNVRATMWAGQLIPLVDADLPSLTVAIPARNETADLQACLESLVRSDYPKLEILVLDDCSQNKQTPEIIRSFAHDGVRFVGGQLPPESWLAKNYAYHQLSQAANGQLILFCGVDARFEPGSLRAMVEAMLSQKKTMISFMPRNILPTSEGLSRWLIQPNRYAWEMTLPRHWIKRPPVLSTCWLITAQQLHTSGGFKAVSRSGSPESYFARTALLRHEYSFIQSNKELGLTSSKSLDEQRATAIRTRYLQVHRRPELVALVSLAELGILIGAPVGLLAGLLASLWALAVLSGLTTIILALAFSQLVSLTYRKFQPSSLWLFPLAALYDMCILNYSMWQYEFNEVIWKGRNICLPVMRRGPVAEKPTAT